VNRSGRNDRVCGWSKENKQQQKQMRGFFPFDYAQGQNDKQKKGLNQRQTKRTVG
jgi:hypothetical protein